MFHVSLLAGISFVKVLSPAWGVIVRNSCVTGEDAELCYLIRQKVCRQIIICVSL